MGLTFTSGHVLGLRRWTASSIGDGFTSIWHRDPAGHWTFYETVGDEAGCSRYFGADVGRIEVGPIEIDWEEANRLHVRTADGAVDWTVESGSTLVTRLMSLAGVAIPAVAWRSPTVLSAMGWVAGHALGAGRLQRTGRTSNAQHFDANPRASGSSPPVAPSSRASTSALPVRWPNRPEWPISISHSVGSSAPAGCS